MLGASIPLVPMASSATGGRLPADVLFEVGA